MFSNSFFFCSQYLKCQCADDLGSKVATVVVTEVISQSSVSTDLEMQLGNTFSEIPISFLALFEKNIKEDKCFSRGLTAYTLNPFIREDNGNRQMYKNN